MTSVLVMGVGTDSVNADSGDIKVFCLIPLEFDIEFFEIAGAAPIFSNSFAEYIKKSYRSDFENRFSVFMVPKISFQGETLDG